MKVLLYKPGYWYNYAIYVRKDGDLYSEALRSGFVPITVEQRRQIDCPVKWTVEP